MTIQEIFVHIAAMKKKYWNASHNCFAFVVGENYELQRCSDDGEPSGVSVRAEAGSDDVVAAA